MLSEPSVVAPMNPAGGGGPAVMVPVSPREGDSFSSSYTTTAVEKFSSDGAIEISTRQHSDTVSGEPRLQLPFDKNGNVILEVRTLDLLLLLLLYVQLCSFCVVSVMSSPTHHHHLLYMLLHILYLYSQ